MEDLEAVPVPPETKTYIPVPYPSFVGLVLSQIEEAGFVVDDSAYAFNKRGAQMFGLLKLEVPSGAPEAWESGMGLAVGLRSSYDKSLSNGVAIGAHVVDGDNLCFRSGLVHVMRKHTKFVWDGLEALLRASFTGAAAGFTEFVEDLTALRDKPCSTDEGYRILGQAIGDEVLTSSQAITAFREWKTPTVPDFHSRNLWSLYNAGSAGLKRGGTGTVIDRHAHWDAFMALTASR